MTTLLCSLSFADNNTFEVSAIHISGNKRTQESVILDQSGLKKGLVSKEQIEKGIQEIYKTQLFSHVTYTLEENNILKIKVRERWTTIPIFKVTSGGGVRQLTLGVYDPNMFGRHIEMGGQYNRLENTQSGVLWLKKPLWNSKGRLNLQVWHTNRLLTKYEQDEELPVIKTGFLRTRKQYFVEIDRKLKEKIRGRVFYMFNDDRFSDRFVSDEVKEKLEEEGLPPASRYHFAGIGITLSNLELYPTGPEGNILGLTYRYALSRKKNLSDFWKFDLDYRVYCKTQWGATLAQRFSTGFSNTETLSYWYYLGGFDKIRGFVDNRFSGKHFWLSNSEYREMLWEKSWAVIQGVFFVDVASGQKRFKELTTISGASTGLGIRVIVPKIYRFVARLDYAQAIKSKDDVKISFGVQQFF